MTISNRANDNILNASSTIIQPYSASNLRATVSCLKIDANTNVTVAWSATLNGTARAAGSSVTIPSALAVAGTQLLFAEASYAYTPIVGYTISGTLTLSDKMYMRTAHHGPKLWRCDPGQLHLIATRSAALPRSAARWST